MKPTGTANGAAKPKHASKSPLAPDALMETDLATAALDMIAVERGYHR